MQQSNVSYSIENRLRTPKWFIEYVCLYWEKQSVAGQAGVFIQFVESFQVCIQETQVPN